MSLARAQCSVQASKHVCSERVVVSGERWQLKLLVHLWWSHLSRSASPERLRSREELVSVCVCSSGNEETVSVLCTD